MINIFYLEGSFLSSMLLFNTILFFGSRSHTKYCIFTYGGTVISWHRLKNTITSTSLNRAKILVIHEARRECVWLRSMIEHVRETCDLFSSKNLPTILYEGNKACTYQVKGDYTKWDKTKHILLKLLYTHDLEENCDIIVR